MIDIKRISLARFLCNRFWIGEHKKTLECTSRIFGNFKIL